MRSAGTNPGPSKRGNSVTHDLFSQFDVRCDNYGSVQELFAQEGHCGGHTKQRVRKSRNWLSI